MKKIEVISILSDDLVFKKDFGDAIEKLSPYKTETHINVDENNRIRFTAILYYEE